MNVQARHAKPQRRPLVPTDAVQNDKGGESLVVQGLQKVKEGQQVTTTGQPPSSPGTADASTAQN